MTIRSLSFVVLLASAGCTSHEMPPESLPTTQDLIPSEFRGVVATIRSLGGTSLSAQPLRLQHTLRNTTGRPVELHDLENIVIPCFEGAWGCVGSGPSSERPTITLSPGQSVSRWVEIARAEPSGDWSLSVNVRSEGTGVGYTFVTKRSQRTIRFRVGYDDKLFTGDTGSEVAPILATPWLDIQVDEGTSRQPSSSPDSE